MKLCAKSLDFCRRRRALRATAGLGGHSAAKEQSLQCTAISFRTVSLRWIVPARVPTARCLHSPKRSARRPRRGLASSKGARGSLERTQGAGSSVVRARRHGLGRGKVTQFHNVPIADYVSYELQEAAENRSRREKPLSVVTWSPFHKASIPDFPCPTL